MKTEIFALLIIGVTMWMAMYFLEVEAIPIVSSGLGGVVGYLSKTLVDKVKDKKSKEEQDT